MTYEECLAYLYSRLPMFQRQGASAYKKDLFNTLEMLRTLGDPHTTFRSIHIAGTNGKGSSAHTLAAVFQAAGYKTGLYTSPHLKSFTERIKINGKEISEFAVVEFVDEMKTDIERISPSFFEVTVCMAFQYFANQEVDIAIIETGLGGRLDSTNVIYPEVSLITNIGMDHTDLLGDTLELIAFEKAGIIKKNIPVVIGTYQPETWPVFQSTALTKKAEIVDATKQVSIIVKDNEYHIQTAFEFGSFSVNPEIKAGYYQKNIPGIVSVLEIMRSNGWKIDATHLQEGINHAISLTGLKGRFQKLQESPLMIADISHNADGMHELLKQINDMSFEKLHLVFGMVKDKSIDQVLQLMPKNAIYYFTQASIPRALPALTLQQQASSFKLIGEVFADVNKAVNTAKLASSKNDLILITGSTFVVAEVEQL